MEGGGRDGLPPYAGAAAAGAFLLLAAALLAAVLAATGGVFSFTLDDPYIHLAMAEEIGRGGYGVNPGEAASASSSVLYPFVLAGLLKLGLGQVSALLVNLVAGAASSALLVALAGEGGLVDRRTPAWAVALLAAGLGLALNLPGLALTGMEHGAHVALALAALLGVQRLARAGREPAWLVPVLVAAPLVRFEGAALLGAGVLALAARRRWTPAVVAAGAAGLALALFAWRLHALGLPPLPSSVLAKAADGARGPAGQFLENQHVREGVLVILAIAFPLGTEVLARGPRPLRMPAAFAAACLAAQLLVGSFGWRWNGWLHRYEAWAMALAAGVLLLCYGGRLRAWLSDGSPGRLTLAVIAAGLSLQPYILTTLSAPEDARAIRLQQREMHRFAAEVLRAPVAVNDLGWVAYRNDNPVLDLWGLGSETARRARQGGAAPEWMDRLARARGVRAAMIYDYPPWIAHPPTRWTKLGELRSRAPTSGWPSVAVYAVEPSDAPAVRVAVDAWVRGLPREDVFVAAPTPGP